MMQTLSSGHLTPPDPPADAAGKVAVDDDVDIAEPNELLLQAIVAWHLDAGSRESMVNQFGAATRLVVEVVDEGTALRPIRPTPETGWWLPIYTAPERLVAAAAEAGRDVADLRYREMSGIQVLTRCLPACLEGTGMVLDPGCDHAVALSLPSREEASSHG